MDMASSSCARCGTANDDGSRFCSACGANLAPQIHCPTCNAVNPLGQKHCTRCGGSLEYAGWGEAAEPGAVVDGVWERGGDELIRRVDPEDARRFLGNRTVRVPAGSVGIVLVDGVVERVLPPGERTSTSLFQRVANFFVQRERTAFYLVDQRPFVVPFVVTTRPSATGQAIKTQVLVTFLLPKGDRDALAMFIANVMRERTSVATGDLYNLLRPEVARIAQAVLERASAAGELSYPDAEADLRRQLADAAGRRYGLVADATLAPLTAVTSLNLHLGTGAAPLLRPCATCRAELPASLRFCDRCGATQPVGTVGGGAVDATTPLFTRDGQQVELDLVVRLQGQLLDVATPPLASPIVSAVAAHLRGVEWAALTAPGGFAALEQAIAAPVAAALAGLGLTLVAIAAVDARSKTGQWLLAARADLDRAAEDVRLGLSWLEQRDAELDLEQLTITRVLREQAQRRDQQFAQDEALAADRERRDGLAARHAAEQQRQRTQVAHTLEVRRTQLDAELAELAARRDLDFAERGRQKRLELELAALAEQQQLEKLRQMALLDREAAAMEHAHELEKRAGLRGLSPEAMIAMQAGELARAEGGGAAWAAVLASSAEAERRHAADTRGVYEQAMAAMAGVAGSRAEAAPVVAAPMMATSVQTVPAAATRACAGCGATMRLDAKFCGACGATA
jgi:Double zinc ribbon